MALCGCQFPTLCTLTLKEAYSTEQAHGSNKDLCSDLPLYVAIANDLCEDLISKLQGRDLVLLILHVNEQDVLTGSQA